MKVIISSKTANHLDRKATSDPLIAAVRENL